MSLTIISLISRPSVEVPFFRRNPDTQSYVENTYVKNNVYTTYAKFSPDQLNRLTVLAFANDADYAAYIEDPRMKTDKAQRAEYNIQNNITTVFEGRIESFDRVRSLIESHGIALD